MKTIIVLFGTLMFLQGCTYAISPAVRDHADKTIPFEKLLADPESCTGKLFILGGTIAQTSTTQQGTLIEVVQKRLDYWGKPEHSQRTGGRFLALHPGHLNPMAYAPGRDITIAGEVQGTSSRLLGDNHYDYPVLLLKEHKLWERERPSWDRPQWIDPLYDPDGPGRRN